MPSLRWWTFVALASLVVGTLAQVFILERLLSGARIGTFQPGFTPNRRGLSPAELEFEQRTVLVRRGPDD